VAVSLFRRLVYNRVCSRELGVTLSLSINHQEVSYGR
jgi:hypothetical protein